LPDWLGHGNPADAKSTGFPMLNQTSLQEISNAGGNVQDAHHVRVVYLEQIGYANQDVEHEQDV
jgi:hypothetical protein